MKFYGLIKKATGKLTIQSRSDMDNYIACLGKVDEDVAVDIEIKKKVRKRTINQNKFYWATLTIILNRMRELGYPPDELDKERLHNFFNGMFNYYEILNEKTGEISKMPRKTSVLDTKEFSEYFDHIKRWCVEWLDITDLPEAGEQLEIE